MTNSIRPVHVASLLGNGEVQTSGRRRPRKLRGSVRKRSWGCTGDWRRNGSKARYMNQGDLYREESLVEESERP
jgi:hypothetical protein